ncbi:MAG: hypothetical protein ACREF7_01760, partial [Candidatus Saccharimonadales bacterium]
SVTAGDSILVSHGSDSQIFIASANKSSGTTSISVDSLTANYAYPSNSSVSDASDLTLASGEELVLTDASQLTCNYLVSPVGVGTDDFEAVLYQPTAPTSYSSAATAKVIWKSWTVSLTGDGDSTTLNLTSGDIAQLVASSDLNLQASPYTQELEIFPANSSYVATGSDLLASPCTSGTTCPSSSYVSATQPLSTSDDCIASSNLDSCFVAEILGPGSAILASSDLEVEWTVPTIPPAPSIEAATSPGTALAGSPQSFWIISPTNTTEDQPLPETQTITSQSITYTYTPEYVNWYFGDGGDLSGQDVLGYPNATGPCDNSSANVSPNTCEGGGGYGNPEIASNAQSSVNYTYQEATNGESFTAPGQCTSASGVGYQWCAVETWGVSGSDGYNGTVTSSTPTYSLQVAQIQGQYDYSQVCALTESPASGEAMAGASVTLTASGCPGSVSDYEFLYEAAGSTTPTVIQGFSNANGATWNTSSLTPG